jgi:hypothetical protein
MIRFYLVFLLLVLTNVLIGQGQIKHMQYNLTLYGNPFGCDETTNSTAEKDVALSEIIAFTEPNILCVNELRDQNIWANRILNNVLNAEQELWSRAELSAQFTSSSIVNGFFYREDLFSLYQQDVVFQSLSGSALIRPIDLYTLYFDTPELMLGDTIFFTCIVAHLSAGDEVERNTQTAALMNYLEVIGPGNYIFSGDLNIDSALEEAFQNLVEPDDETIAFIDPVPLPDQWNNNSSVAQYHTQSTRFSDTNSGCFSGGGLDDRFDITLISPFIQGGTQGLQYVAGSYEVLGQNGNDYNQELQVFMNGSVPDEIALALYKMSDHLPVLTEYSTDLLSGGTEVIELTMDMVIQPDGGLQIGLRNPDLYEVDIIDLSGRLIVQEQFDGRVFEMSIGSLNTGLYLLRVTGNGQQAVKKLMR